MVWLYPNDLNLLLQESHSLVPPTLRFDCLGMPDYLPRVPALVSLRIHQDNLSTPPNTRYQGPSVLSSHPHGLLHYLRTIQSKGLIYTASLGVVSGTEGCD